MPASKRFRDHNTNGYLTVDARVMFADGGQVETWLRRLTGRARHEIAKAAPSNKRPRWGHYGPPLKMTIKRSIKTRKGSGGKWYYLYTSVGSTAPYALYVDQGSGIHAGKSPWEAKILPPWPAKGYELYEKKRDGRRVMIDGQEGKFFFEKGLERAFDRMIRRSFQPVGLREGVSGIEQTFLSMPQAAISQLAATPYSPAFQMSLNKWRLWKSEAREKYREDQARDAAFRAARVPRHEDVAARMRRERDADIEKGRKILASREKRTLREKAEQDARDARKAKREADAKAQADLTKRRDRFKTAETKAMKKATARSAELTRRGIQSRIDSGFMREDNENVIFVTFYDQKGRLRRDKYVYWKGRKP